jgi:tetratricopeptide (TPR) repeat protein
MLNKINITPPKQILIVYIVLILAILAVYWQVNKYDFVNLDDVRYVTENSHIQSGITPDGILWAFSTTHAEFWHPLTWLSLMFDYQLYGLNAGGYHLTNLILHILSTLLLFWLFCRMTGAVWKSAFVAALFALHPMHVESVAWISERKDVLSAFFWMLTLCLYVYYTEKPFIRRYLLVVFSFVCALMSKPIVVTLPVIMILLDYWPLKRFESKKNNLILWQLKEKIPFFVLSAIFSIITLLAQYNPSIERLAFPLTSRIANAPVSFVTYLGKTFWPHDLAVFYPFSDQLPIWQVLGATLLIIVISSAVIVMVKRLPYLFVGWIWYAITISPVIGIIQVGDFAMADRYHYLPSIGIAVMLAWGIPSLIQSEDIRKKILFPAAIAFLTVMSILTWQQCRYWENTIELFKHTLQVTKDNDLAHNNIAYALAEKGKIKEAIDHYSKAISLKPYDVNIYSNRGNAYVKLGQHQQAVEDYNEAIRLKPDYAPAYINRGNAYTELGQYQMAIEDFNKALHLKPDYADTIYNNIGDVYNKLGQYQFAINNFSKAIHLNHVYIKAYNNRATTYGKLGQYQRAIEDYNEVIRLKPDYPPVYFNRGNAYINLGQYQTAIEDLNKVIRLDPASFDAYNNRAFIYIKLGQYQQALEDYSKAILLKPDYTDAYNNRAIVCFTVGDKLSGCRDAQKACKLGDCKTLEGAKGKGLCR